MRYHCKLSQSAVVTYRKLAKPLMGMLGAWREPSLSIGGLCIAHGFDTPHVFSPPPHPTTHNVLNRPCMHTGALLGHWTAYVS